MAGWVANEQMDEDKSRQSWLLSVIRNVETRQNVLFINEIQKDSSGVYDRSSNIIDRFLSMNLTWRVPIDW